jgi:hypothetical protein
MWLGSINSAEIVRSAVTLLPRPSTDTTPGTGHRTPNVTCGCGVADATQARCAIAIESEFEVVGCKIDAVRVEEGGCVAGAKKEC